METENRMLLEENSIELNLNADPELTQAVIKEFRLWDTAQLNLEYRRLITKLAFVLSDALETGVAVSKEPYIMKIIQLIKRTHDALVQNMFENKDIIKHLLAFSVLVARDLYIFGHEEEAGAMTPILVNNLKRYRGDDAQYV